MAVTYSCKSFGILAETSNDVQREKCVVATYSLLGSVTKPAEQTVNDLCKSLCASCGCPYYEKVFDGDITAIYVQKQIDSDSITFTLKKNGVELVTVSDSSLGEWSESEFWKADWQLIRNLYGGGNYTICVNYDVLSVQYTQESHNFQLTIFDECTADGCVKFEWWQEGSLVSGKQYDPAEYYSTRLMGRMSEETPELDKETYQQNDRTIKPIQTTVKRIYKFESKLIPYSIKEMIMTNLLIGNDFLVNDFNVGTKEFTNKSLELEGISELKDLQGSEYYKIVLTFIDSKQDLIKRSC